MQTYIQIPKEPRRWPAMEQWTTSMVTSWARLLSSLRCVIVKAGLCFRPAPAVSLFHVSAAQKPLGGSLSHLE